MSFALDQQLERVVIALCDDIATPMAALVKGYVQTGEWVKLQQLKVSPRDYQDSESYFRDALVVDLLRKADIESGIDKRAAAVATFWECENQNAKTNARLSRFLPETLFIEDTGDRAVLEFIEDWRKEISSVLKSLPDSLTVRFGKGSTYGDKGQLITVPDKMSTQPTITSGSRCLMPFWGVSAWARALIAARPWESDPEVVRGNRFSAVPKTGLTLRGICIEPSINISLQLDVGRLMKARLQAYGIDLLHGQHVHRERAQAASFMNSDSTIDMSNASDTVCRILPKLVIRTDWWELLDSLRSPMTEIDGKWVRLEKFSSMGNGFTFELETLLFVTLARLIVTREGGDSARVLCYGDDLIVPKQHSQSVLSALAFFGFTPNRSKTFTDGPFRESCGGDYWDGVPVRAHFIQELPYEPQHWISLANGLRRAGFSDPCNPDRFRYIKRAWQRCLDALPSNIRRYRGPVSLGDIVVHDDECYWNKFTDDRGNPCVRTYAPIPEVLQWNNWVPEVHLASALFGLPSDGVTPRGGISGYRHGHALLYSNKWLPKPRLYQSLPWIEKAQWDADREIERSRREAMYPAVFSTL